MAITAVKHLAPPHMLPRNGETKRDHILFHGFNQKYFLEILKLFVENKYFFNTVFPNLIPTQIGGSILLGPVVL